MLHKLALVGPIDKNSNEKVGQSELKHIKWSAYISPKIIWYTATRIKYNKTQNFQSIHCLFFILLYFHRRYRYTGYRQLVRWCWGRLGKKIRVPLPSCCMKKIQGTYTNWTICGLPVCIAHLVNFMPWGNPTIKYIM